MGRASFLPLLENSGRHANAAWLRRLRDRTEASWDDIRESGLQQRHHLSERATYVLSEAFSWMSELPANSIHAVIADPPYGLIEYDEKNHAKLRSGRGGVWRIPPKFDGANRRPVPRFTILKKSELAKLHAFFHSTAEALLRILVPGGHAFIASNPLVSTMTFHAFMDAGFEKRGEVIRLLQTLRGGDRPKGAEHHFEEVSVMPRSCWEPWGIFRKPFSGTVASNLRERGTGGLRRTSEKEPFKDVIQCSPTRGSEKNVAPHPSLKPQRFLRKLVRAALPLEIGIIYDPFAGSGSTLAAAEAMGYAAIGTDNDSRYFEMAKTTFAPLSILQLNRPN